MTAKARRNEIQSPLELPRPPSSSTGICEVEKKMEGRHCGQQGDDNTLTITSRAAQYVANT